MSTDITKPRDAQTGIARRLVEIDPDGSSEQEFEIDLPVAGAYLLFARARTRQQGKGEVRFSLDGELQPRASIEVDQPDVEWKYRRKCKARAFFEARRAGTSKLRVEWDANTEANEIFITSSTLDYADEEGVHEIDFKQPHGSVYDLVVYGGNPAGIMAAIQASRKGLSCLIIERTSHLGGLHINGVCTDEGPHTQNNIAFGGMNMEFYEQVARRYKRAHPGEERARIWEPFIAEQCFAKMIDREERIFVLANTRIEKVSKANGTITQIETSSGDRFEGRVFVDATYEGNLLCRAGVSYTFGREARSEYGESLAGITFDDDADCDALEVEGSVRGDDGELLFPLQGWKSDYERGSGDKKPQAMNLQAITTIEPENGRPFEKPTGYDPRRYELYKRYVNKIGDDFETAHFFNQVTIPYGKFIVNSRQTHGMKVGLSTSSGALYFDYPDSDYAGQEDIARKERDFFVGLFYFLTNDSTVHSHVRKVMSEFQLPRDEYLDNDNLPYWIYCREARRMVGDYVMTQADIQKDRSKPDSIALGAHKMDAHVVQRLASDENVFVAEGKMFAVLDGPYEIPYRILRPKKSECANLLVTSTTSCSHVAQTTLRTGATVMTLGQVAGLAAYYAIKGDCAVQDVDVAVLRSELKSLGVKTNVRDLG